jgi:hypothetical protein
MSYDLYFWRYKDGVVLDHQETCEKLADCLRVKGVEDLPISQMMKRVARSFPKWTCLDTKTFDHKTKGAFQIYSTPQLFCVYCTGMAGDDMNRFIDIGKEFGCPLFDPQVEKRFEL